MAAEILSGHYHLYKQFILPAIQNMGDNIVLRGIAVVLGRFEKLRRHAETKAEQNQLAGANQMVSHPQDVAAPGSAAGSAAPDSAAPGSATPGSAGQTLAINRTHLLSAQARLPAPTLPATDDLIASSANEETMSSTKIVNRDNNEILNILLGMAIVTDTNFLLPAALAYEDEIIDPSLDNLFQKRLGLTVAEKAVWEKAIDNDAKIKRLFKVLTSDEETCAEVGANICKVLKGVKQIQASKIYQPPGTTLARMPKTPNPQSARRKFAKAGTATSSKVSSSSKRTRDTEAARSQDGTNNESTGRKKNRKGNQYVHH